MTTDAILESGMRFGPYPAGQCFYIEKSQSYKRIEEGVQIAEFLLLRRHNAPADAPVNELPTPFQTLDLQQTGFRFVLVINGHKDEWLPPVQEALSLALKPVVKTWALPPTSVAVMNHTLAEKYGLVSPIAAQSE